jgi:hypothetical protein
MLQTDTVAAMSGETQTDNKVKTEWTQIYPPIVGNISTQVYPLCREHLSQTSIADLKDCYTQYEIDAEVYNMDAAFRELPTETEKEKKKIDYLTGDILHGSQAFDDNSPLALLELKTEGILKVLERSKYTIGIVE